jgi:hypothetical protein
MQGFMSTKITKTIGNSICRCRASWSLLVVFLCGKSERVPFLDTGGKERRIRCIRWDQIREY